MTAESEPPLIDEPILTALAGAVGTRAMPDLIDGFIKDLETRAAVLPALTGAALASELHALKSTAGTFGAQRLFEAALTLDEAVQGAAPADLKKSMAMVMDVLHATRTAYKKIGGCG